MEKQTFIVFMTSFYCLKAYKGSMYISFNHNVFIFHIFGSFFFAFIHRCSTLYVFEMYIMNHMQCDVSYFYKTCILLIVKSGKNLVLVAWRYIHILGMQKKFRYRYFEKNSTVNRYFQKKLIGILVFCNPILPPGGY